jgi:plasmid stabilization system protein ParE
MKKFNILHTHAADLDLFDIYEYIRNEVHMPAAAQKYRKGIKDTIQSLRTLCPAYAINQCESLQSRYGPGARTVVYKKYTIIYRIKADTVFILRIIASALIY